MVNNWRLTFVLAIFLLPNIAFACPNCVQVGEQAWGYWVTVAFMLFIPGIMVGGGMLFIRMRLKQRQDPASEIKVTHS